jgi:hypothetical protein
MTARTRTTTGDSQDHPWGMVRNRSAFHFRAGSPLHENRHKCAYPSMGKAVSVGGHGVTYRLRAVPVLRRVVAHQS